VWCTCSFACCLLQEIGNVQTKRVRFTKRGAFSPVLSSTRDYSEGSVRLEVRVPTVGKPSKSEDVDTQESERCEEVQSFLSSLTRAEFLRNCETTQLSIVLRQYSTSTQYRAAQSDKVRDVSKLQFLQYSSYWNRSFGSDFIKFEVSRQQRPQYWFYRDSITAASSVRRPLLVLLQRLQHSNCLGNSVIVLDLQRQYFRQQQQ
jgi:hypothetical protein